MTMRQLGAEFFLMNDDSIIKKIWKYGDFPMVASQ